MAEHKCNTCFYKNFDKDKEFPCKACDNYNAYVNYMAYKPVDTMTVHTWDDEDAFDAWDKEQYMKQSNNYSDHGGGSTLDDYPELKENMMVDSPAHYTHGSYEVIDVIEDWDLNFRLANAVKYIARHKHKGKPLEDLKKAAWYLQREIDKWSSPSKN